MGFDVNEISKNSKGGTELMRMGLEQRLDPSLLEDFQIIPSRVRELQNDKIRILWLHDLPGDPESDHLRNGGHEKFHLLVFVTHWQMQSYCAYYSIPWSKCVVIENAIEPIDKATINKPTDKIKLIYHTTPHRGLKLLVPVFEKLCEEFDNIELDVFSSFKIYGWEQRDAEYEALFEQCRTHPKINYHGTVSNEEVRKALGEAHIFAYPSIWTETSCLSLMEAMSAECICVHPNLGALFETAGGTTVMYQWNEVEGRHAGAFYSNLQGLITRLNSKDEAAEAIQGSVKVCSGYANIRYNWTRAVSVWNDVLHALKAQYPTEESRKDKGPTFHYVVG